MIPDNSLPEDGRRTHSRLKLLFIISLFLGPLLFSFLWYYGFGAAHAPTSQSNHASLVRPVVQITDFSNALYVSGEVSPSVSLSSLKKLWTVVHIVSSECDDECQKSLYNTRQTRIAIGKDISRIQRYIILENDNLAAELQAIHPDAQLLKSGNNGIEVQLQPVMQDIGANDALLVDPLGNVMMTIPVSLNPGLLLKDLKKLLKLSHIG